MRSMFRSMLLALVAVFVMSVVAAGSASAALPEFSPSGTANAPVTFALAMGSSKFSSGIGNWEYLEGSGRGQIVAGAVRSLVLHWTNPIGACVNEKNGLVSQKLKGRLGYINSEKKEVGLLLEPETAGPVAVCEREFHGKEEYRGSIIARITPVNKPAAEPLLTFSRTAQNLQEPESFEGEATKHHLESVSGERKSEMTMSSTMQLRSIEHEGKSIQLEVKA
jgi:hypothetical protein